MKAIIPASCFTLVLFICSCSESRHYSEHSKATSQGDTTANTTYAIPEAIQPPAQWKPKIIQTAPHDKTCYTQGLETRDGIMYETGGLVGRSTLRKIDINTWKTLQIVKLPQEVFGEGLTVLGNKLYVLTWRDGRCLIYDPKSLRLIGETSYRGEGWGLCNDGESLIMTNGSNTITFISPEDFHIRRSISVFDNGRPIDELNEVEYINGEIWANVYQTDNIVRIDPQTGAIIGWIDASGLLNDGEREAGAEVLNGIANDSSRKTIYLTGKFWPKLLAVKFEPSR